MYDSYIVPHAEQQITIVKLFDGYNIMFVPCETVSVSMFVEADTQQQ